MGTWGCCKPPNGRSTEVDPEATAQWRFNLKMSITKITGVSFGTPKDYMLQNLKMMPLSDLGNPNSATNGRITFHLCSCSKFVSPIVFTFHQNKALKKL